jgi:protein-S-isoprenylcysteine O-methyltransferase Ste14
MSHDSLTFRLIIMVQFFAMAVVRFYFGAPRVQQSAQATVVRPAEPLSLTMTLGVIALLHFGTIFGYLASPRLLRAGAFEVAMAIRWVGVLISCLGVAGEIWAALALGASYSPALRIAEERTVVTAGPYRWIRHPLYAFWLPTMLGWGIAAGNWFVLLSGAVLILVLLVVRVPREEEMMLEGFGDAYREYMTSTGRFIPRLRFAQQR